MNKELDFIQTMFDSIAPKYDFLNRFLSLRQDVYWRKEMVQASNLDKDALVLDVACGTCDVGIEIQKQHTEQYKTQCKVVSTDFSHNMLSFAQKKIHLKTNKTTLNLAAGNALFLPFKENLFDALFIAFGIRNIMDRATALKEFKRCLKKKGRVVVLELTTPAPSLLKDLYILYFKKLLPLVGAFFSKNAGAYSYLPESVLKFPEPLEFAKIMKNAGFTNIRYKQMTFGIVTLFTGIKK
ncbi:MAG: bifunctional demethylmenaquinone methyltransferase/2-methoxy-6-polyprenyl-1,4-benzoquinol methylase UbiE [Desulfobacteraceae bacterium]|nr:bifunctional demethylmenaquinone methyltransferase/2-methoxy-6-polyprenyl-1,4-benzoquinol methylase UbiE [Desulfobacteraceae bacterium]